MALGKYSTSYQGQEAIKQSYPASTPMNHNYQHGKISIKVSKWHLHISGSQWLFNQTYGPLNRREIMPCTGNIASFLHLVRSWTFEKNTLLLLCQSNTFLPLIHIGKCSYHPAPTHTHTIREDFLYRIWRSSQKTTMDHGGTQPPQMHLHLNS